jgi:hypothetical protein
VAGVVLNLGARVSAEGSRRAGAAPLPLAFGAGAEPVTGVRRRMLRAGAAVVLVAAGSPPIPAVAALVRGGSTDWIGPVPKASCGLPRGVLRGGRRRSCVNAGRPVSAPSAPARPPGGLGPVRVRPARPGNGSDWSGIAFTVLPVRHSGLREQGS